MQIARQDKRNCYIGGQTAISMKYETEPDEITKGIQILVENGEAFAFLHEDEAIYDESDLIDEQTEGKHLCD